MFETRIDGALLAAGFVQLPKNRSESIAKLAKRERGDWLFFFGKRRILGPGFESEV